jgi:hypothetical protein
MYDPFAAFRVSCDWTCHVTRTPPSSGGTDYGMSTGTPIRAAFAGILTNRPPVQFPNSGNVAILTAPAALAASLGVPDLAFYHLHLSQFVTPGPVAEGDIIGYSGNTGFSTGPHLHINAFVGNTPRDVHDFYPSTNTVSGLDTTALDSTPITSVTPPTQEEIDEMTATKDAAILRNYEVEGNGQIATALIFPGGTIVLLNKTQDVDSACVAHVQAYGIPATNPTLTNVREKYGSQVNDAQWKAFIAVYPGTKVGF